MNHAALALLPPPGLPSCLDLKEGARGDCYLLSGTDRHGYVVYANYRGCLNSWLAIPGFMLLPTWGLATIYLLILLYLFVGVALASDKFMAAIEVICSATRRSKRRCPVTGEVKVVRVPVWNWVVANVSLMAVGSSAPEILLAVVESILRLGKPAGELGPSTIVGSAAYNLMMISAVCTAALPIGVVKHVRHVRVFVTTAIISMWAYVWMLIVYLWWTPNEVTVTEAALTLLQFVLLLVIGWAVDVRVWRRFGRRRRGVAGSDDEGGPVDAVVTGLDGSNPPPSSATLHADALESGLVGSWQPLDPTDLGSRSHIQLTSTTTAAVSTHNSHSSLPGSVNQRVGFNASTHFHKTPSFQSEKSDKSDNRVELHLQQQPQLQQQPPAAATSRQLWSEWRQQFVEAIEYDSKATVGDDGEEEEAAGGVLGLIMHFVSLFWKLCCATIPPEWWLGGWPCFWGSLLWIIALVVVVDESATVLGCVMGLSPLVVGMSLVALGTSLPDTFCSRTAALKDSHADAAVGNITGSNAANVFVGLGLPWLISSCYYSYRGERFCSDSGALAFSVLVFSMTALVWLAVLFARRVVAGGELGAKSVLGKWGVVLVALVLWGAFLTLTGLASDGRLDDSWIAVSGGTCTSSATAAR